MKIDLNFLLHSAAIFAGHGAQVKFGHGDLRIGVFHLVEPPSAEDPENIILHFSWLARHSFPECQLFDGEKEKEIKMPVAGFQCAIGLNQHAEFKRVIVSSGSLHVVLFTRKGYFNPKESKVTSWVPQ